MVSLCASKVRLLVYDVEVNHCCSGHSATSGSFQDVPNRAAFPDHSEAAGAADLILQPWCCWHPASSLFLLLFLRPGVISRWDPRPAFGFLLPGGMRESLAFQTGMEAHRPVLSSWFHPS